MNNHAGWAPEGICVACGAPEPVGACDPDQLWYRLQETTRKMLALEERMLSVVAPPRLSMFRDVDGWQWAITTEDGTDYEGEAASLPEAFASIEAAITARKADGAH